MKAVTVLHFCYQLTEREVSPAWVYSIVMSWKVITLF